MGKIEFSGIDEVLMTLSGIEDGLDELTDGILDDGAAIIKSNIEQSIREHRHFRTGALLASIKISKKKNKDGKSASITAVGTDGNGVRNAEKASVLNHGRSNMPGTRFWSQAEVKSRGEIEASSNKKVEDYYKKKGLK